MSDNKPSDERNGSWLDSMWCCKVCDGEIPHGHTDNCDIWKLEKKHRDFIANEYNAALIEIERLRAEIERLRAESARDHNRWAVERLALRAENERLRDALCKVGDDYPGSSCQLWCYQEAGRTIPDGGSGLQEGK